MMSNTGEAMQFRCAQHDTVMSVYERAGATLILKKAAMMMNCNETLKCKGHT